MKKGASVLRKLVRNMSRDVIPHIDNYRMRYQMQTQNRPSLHELCNPQDNLQTENQHAELTVIEEVYADDKTKRDVIRSVELFYAATCKRRRKYKHSRTGNQKNEVWLDRRSAHPQYDEHLGCYALFAAFVGSSASGHR